MLADLGETQYRVFKFVEHYIEKNGYSPSLEEIGDAVGKHSSSAKYHVDQLVKKGYLEKVPGAHRCIALVMR